MNKFSTRRIFLNEKSLIATVITEIRKDMSDKELSEALNTFTNGKYHPATNTLQKYRTGQREPNYSDFKIIVAYGQANKYISPSTSARLANSFILPNFSKMDFEEAVQPSLSSIFEALNADLHLPITSQSNVQIPIMSKVAARDEKRSSDYFISLPKSMLYGDDYFWLTISDEAWRDVNIFKDDLVLIRKSSKPENNQMSVIRLKSDEIVCKNLITTVDGRIVLLPATVDSLHSISPSEVEIIGVVEKIIRNYPY